MNKKDASPILIIRAKGPATEDGRIPLQDLLKLGKHVQTAVNRVARVLTGEADSRSPGRAPKEISEYCPLEVVALNKKCFEIALDLPRRKFEAMHLGIEAVEKMAEGIGRIGDDIEEMPPGYDMGVLQSLRDMGQILNGGITEIEAETRTQRLQKTFHLNKQVHQRVQERIKKPVSNERAIEGRLMMADFIHESEKCRIHPPAGGPISCQFDESLEERIYEHLRRYVRVTGETREDPASGKIVSIKIRDIEEVKLEGEEFETSSADAFWREKSIDQLAAEQGVRPITRLEDILGKGADLWEDEEDFDAFLKATKGIEA